MELWLALGGLWLFECLAYFPPGAALLRGRGAGAVRVEPRSGLALVAPWPGAFAAILDGLPFEVTRECVSARGSLSLFAGTAGLDDERRLPLDGLAPEARGARVLGAGGPLLRASSDAAARRIAGWLATLAGTAADDRARAWLALFESALDPGPVASVLRRARRANLPLRALATLAFAGALAGVPALAVASGLGFGAAWDLAWPALAVLHGLGWSALGVAEWQLRAPGAALRLFRALVYPPALWRAALEQASAALGGFHPLAVALAVCGEPERERLARRALAECRWPAFARHGGAVPDADERRAALAVRAERLGHAFAAAGLSRERLAAPPQRRTPHAASYCPVCESEFVVGGWTCPDCRIEAVGY